LSEILDIMKRPQRSTARKIIEKQPGIAGLEMGWFKKPGRGWRPTEGLRDAESVKMHRKRGETVSLHTHPTGGTSTISAQASFEDLAVWRGNLPKMNTHHIACINSEGKVVGYVTYLLRNTFNRAFSRLAKQHGIDLWRFLTAQKKQIAKHGGEIHGQLIREGHLKVRFTPMPGYGYATLNKFFFKKSEFIYDESSGLASWKPKIKK